MNLWLLASAALLALIAIVHSAMGERLIFRPWNRQPPTQVRYFHQQILRASWHLPSLLGAAQATLLAIWGAAPASALPDAGLQQATLAALAVGVAACGVVVLWLTRGRHQGGTALLVAALLMSVGLARAGEPTAPAPLKTITTLDLPRYMGRWYELARYPNRFQKQCAGAATADYSLLPKGTVQVVNRCPKAAGQVDEAIGEARRVGPEGSPTLQVRFAPAWLSFLPQVWGHYWVVELDADYQLAVVSEPQREFLWVLSRTPQLPAAHWTALNARLVALGFDPVRLVRGDAP